MKEHVVGAAEKFFELFNNEPTLIPDSGRTSNNMCNPLEYNAIGEKMHRTSEELGIITDFKESVLECMSEQLANRDFLNKCRKKFDINIREWCEEASRYSHKEVKDLMDAFSRLDENDDLLIDREEFLEALLHFNPKTKKSADTDVFTIADKKGNNVIDFEEFLQLCAIIDGHSQVPDKSKQARGLKNI